MVEKRKPQGLGPGQELLLEQCFALTSCGLGQLAALLILQEVSYRFPNGNSEAAVRRELTQRIGIDLHESGLAVGALPTARIGRKTDKLARRQSSIDPLGAVASAIAAVSSGTGRIVTGVDRKHATLQQERAIQPFARYDQGTPYESVF